MILRNMGTSPTGAVLARRISASTADSAIASGAAFLVAQMVDVQVFDTLRGGRWWRAPLVSTLLGSALDTVLFFGIAFAAVLPADTNTGWANEAVPLLGAGPFSPLWVSLALADWMVKLGLAILALVPFRIIVRNLLGHRAES